MVKVTHIDNDRYYRQEKTEHVKSNQESYRLKYFVKPVLPFVIPAVVFSAAFFIWENWPVWTTQSEYARELTALSVALPYLPYLLLGAGLLLGWRFHQSGMVLCAWLLGVGYWAMESLDFMPGSACRKILTCLVFIEMAVFSSWRWRQVPLKKTISWLVLVLLQPLILIAAAHLLADGTLSPDAAVSSPLLKHVGSFFRRPDLSFLFESQPELTLFYIIGCIFLLGTFQKQDVLLAGFLGMLLAIFIGLGPGKIKMGMGVSFSVAGAILLLSCIEASFIMAYRDDLTGLPSRRALNQALAGLGTRYTIAMIDVDHFKQFNDTYGHKSGDQVLKLLAARLNRMSGGAKPFRYGGEEFTALFPGKTVEEALPHLESCRKRLAENPFIVRGKARRKSSARRRGTSSKEKGRKQVAVTASFGIAQPTSKLKTPSEVLGAADKALYRAKKAGRNCVKS